LSLLFIFVSTSRVIGCQDRLRNGLHCARRHAKLCSLIRYEVTLALSSYIMEYSYKRLAFPHFWAFLLLCNKHRMHYWKKNELSIGIAVEWVLTAGKNCITNWADIHCIMLFSDSIQKMHPHLLANTVSQITPVHF